MSRDDPRFGTAFPHAAGVTRRRFRRRDGAAEHCAAGAVELVAAEVVRWLGDRARQPVAAPAGI